MRKKEIKEVKTIEEVVRVEFVAEDGQVFTDEKECIMYEKSALFAVSKKLKRLTKDWTSQFAFNNEYSENDELEIFDIQTESDLENLKRYLYLKMTLSGANENDIKECFSSKDVVDRKDYVFENVTAGHEVMIFWEYGNSWFWVYKDGSLNGYLEWVKEKYAKLLMPDDNQ